MLLELLDELDVLLLDVKLVINTGYFIEVVFKVLLKLIVVGVTIGIKANV
jgi:hypothetical protein